MCQILHLLKTFFSKRSLGEALADVVGDDGGGGCGAAVAGHKDGSRYYYSNNGTIGFLCSKLSA